VHRPPRRPLFWPASGGDALRRCLSGCCRWPCARIAGELKVPLWFLLRRTRCLFLIGTPLRSRVDALGCERAQMRSGLRASTGRRFRGPAGGRRAADILGGTRGAVNAASTVPSLQRALTFVRSLMGKARGSDR
jgi:hypothetical protein